jgi:hypothetical protein
VEGNDAAFVRIAVTIDGTVLHGLYTYLLARSNDFCYAGPVETRFAAVQTGMGQTLNNEPILSSIAGRTIKTFREKYKSMKIGFICLNLPGHLNPMTAVAHQLQTRGHDVVFLYLPNANGLPCIPAEKNDEVNATRPAVSKLAGWEALKFYCGIIAKETAKILESLPQMWKEQGSMRSYSILINSLPN